MKRKLLVLALAVACHCWLAQQCRAEAENKPEVVREFIGEVKEIVSIHEYGGKAILVHFDPRFVVRIAVVRPVKDAPEVEEKELVYAIHSVAETFVAPREQVVGKTFRFKETRTKSVINGKEQVSHWLNVVHEAAERTEHEAKEKH